MCGICGQLLFDPGERVERMVLESMCASIRHRGPDDQGIYLGGSVGLGATRLAIIDLETG